MLSDGCGGGLTSGAMYAPFSPLHFYTILASLTECFGLRCIQVVWHNGDIPGVNTILGFLPSDGLGYAVLINSDIGAQQELVIASQIIANFIAGSSNSSNGRIHTTNDSMSGPLTSASTQAAGIATSNFDIVDWTRPRVSPPRIGNSKHIHERRVYASSVMDSLSLSRRYQINATTTTTTNASMPPSSSPSSSPSTSPSQPPIDFSGTYQNLGYGNLTLCSASSLSPSPSSDSNNSNNGNTACTELLANFSAVDKASGLGLNASDPASGELVGNWGKFFAPQVRLAPIPQASTGAGSADSPASWGRTDEKNANAKTNETVLVNYAYVIIMSKLYPQGYGNNETAFEEVVGAASVTFVVEIDSATTDVGGIGMGTRRVAGFGLSGTVGEETDREREFEDGTVEEVADAWFVKV